MMASKHKLNNFHIIIDYNKIQSYGKTKEVMDLEPLKGKLQNFGYKTEEVNGHDVNQLFKYFKKLKKIDQSQQL